MTENFTSFPADRSGPCFCSSGKQFLDCCGSGASDRPPPYGLYVFHDYLPAKFCDDVIKYARKQTGSWLGVEISTGALGENVEQRSEGRVTQRINLGKLRTRVNNKVKAAFSNVLLEQYQQEMEWFESADLLYYQPGGLYGMHADSENYMARHQQWVRAKDRDYSLLLYLNDDFEGGHIKFNNFNYHYKPQKGDLVVFPSDHRYLHEAMPVTSGERFAVVSWCAVKGSIRVAPGPPPSAVYS